MQTLAGISYTSFADLVVTPSDAGFHCCPPIGSFNCVLLIEHPAPTPGFCARVI